MTFAGWLQIAIIFLIVIALIKPLGLFMSGVFQGKRTFLSPVLRPVEVGFYKLAGIKEDSEQSWLSYTMAMLVFSLFGFLSLYAILRLQAYLPLNPQGFDNVPPDLAFNTAISFLTNTNWQAYGGETTMSHFTQMAGLAVHNFLSAATGIALAAAVMRAFARSGSRRSAVSGSISPAPRSTSCCHSRSSSPSFSSRKVSRRRCWARSTSRRSTARSRRSRSGRWRARRRSSSSAPMAAAS